MQSSWRVKFEPLITPLFRTYWSFSRGLTLGVRGIATDDEHRVLLVRHTYTSGWHLPGGGVERGETIYDAIAREMAEEAGVEAIARPKMFRLYSNHARHKNDHVAVFVIKTWRTCATLDNNEIAERRFFPVDALPEGVTPGASRRLAEIFHGADISPEW